MTTTKSETSVDLLLKMHNIAITETQQAGFEDFRQHVIELDGVRTRIKHEKKRLSKLNTEEPHQPAEVEDWREWIIHCELWKRHQQDVETLQETIREMEKREQAVAIPIIKFMPEMVWFKVDHFAVGVSYTNWGGGSRQVVIAKWGLHHSIKLDLRVND